jgi:hypothetical protein
LFYPVLEFLDFFGGEGAGGRHALEAVFAFEGGDDFGDCGLGEGSVEAEAGEGGFGAVAGVATGDEEGADFAFEEVGFFVGD